MTTTSSSRSAGLDLVRCFAIFCVVAVHFSLNSHYGEVPFYGMAMFVQGVGQNFFSIGVSLFILLTGYLNSRKELSWKYYKGAVRVLASYLLFSVVIIVFRVYYMEEHNSLLKWVLMVSDFSAIPYGWYIEMWIGLFLLAPFMNILWKHLPGRAQKLSLLATLAFVAIVPSFLNRGEIHLVPAFWESVWPLFLYFTGAFIRDEQVCPSKYLLSGGVCLCCVNPAMSILSSYIQVPDNPAPINHYTGSLCTTIVAVIMFLLLYRRDTRCEWLRRWLASVSKASLDMYLCCYMFDALFYPFFMERYYESQAQFGWWFFVLVPLVFAVSYATALLKKLVCRF